MKKHVSASCVLHPRRRAFKRCHSCGQHFCSDCLIEGTSHYYCADEGCMANYQLELDFDLKAWKRGSLKGVRGWLLLLCGALIVLTPLLTGSQIVRDYHYLSMYFDQVPSLAILAIIKGLSSIGLIGLAIYAGVSLFRVKAAAVTMTMVYLGALLGYNVIAWVLPLIWTLPLQLAYEMAYQATIQLLASLVFVAAVHPYLTKSKRVKITYYKSRSTVPLNLSCPSWN